MDEASADLLGDHRDNGRLLPRLICTTRRNIDSGFIAPRRHHVPRCGPPRSGRGRRRARSSRRPRSRRCGPTRSRCWPSGRPGTRCSSQELVGGGRDRTMDSLPDTIDALITAQIDRLPPNDRMFLRRASVLGHTFRVDLLRAVVRRAAGARRRRVDPPLRLLVATTTRARSRSSTRCVRDMRVRRALVPRATTTARAGRRPDPRVGGRRTRHRGGAALGALPPRAALRRGVGLLARSPPRQAKAVYANVEAAELYERRDPGLPLRSRTSASGEMVGVHEELGDVLDRVGTYAAAQRAYRAARRLVRDDPVAEAGLLMKLAWVQGGSTGTPRRCAGSRGGLKTLEGVEGHEACPPPGPAPRVVRPLLPGRRPAHAAAIRWCTLAVSEAEAVGSRRRVGARAPGARLGLHGSRAPRRCRQPHPPRSPSTRSSAT